MAIYKDIVKKIPISAEKKTKQKQYLSSGVLPIIDQGQQIIGGYTDDISKKIDCDLPVIVFGDHTRCVKLIKFAFAPGADGIKVVGPVDDSVVIEYLFYATKYLAAKIRDKGYARHYQDVEKQELEIPAVLKQKEIVLKLEKELSSLDNAVETLNKTKEQLAVYRQAVLKEIFEYSDDSDIVELQNIVDDIRIGPFGTMLHKSDYIDAGIPVINPQHIKNQKIRPSVRVSISEERAKELESYRIRTNDVVMGRRGEMGRTAPVTSNEEGWICGTGSIIVRLKPEYDAAFYSQILASQDTVHYLEKKSTGTTMNNLNEDIVKHIPVPKITVKEQCRIKETLDSKISVCGNIEQTVDTVLAQAEAMRQSILKEAFEGRLV